MGAGGKQTTAVAWGVVALAILAAAPIMAASFRAQNDGGFAVSAWALLLGVVWLAAGLIILSQRRPLPVTRRSTTSSRLAILLIAANGLAVASLVGGLVLAWWPAMAHFVAEPLRVATSQHLAVLLVVAFATGAAEEVFFRLALPTLLRGWWRWAVPTLVYALVTLASGSLALAVMAAILSVVAMWALAETGWWFAPLVVHAAWTIAMIGIFPALAPH